MSVSRDRPYAGQRSNDQGSHFTYKFESSTLTPVPLAALADDITVSTLDTIGASSRAVVYGDNTEFQSPRLATSSLSPAFLDLLKKRLSYSTSVDWPTADSSNVASHSYESKNQSSIEGKLEGHSVSSFQWVNDTVGLYEKKRTSVAVSKTDFFMFSTNLYSSSSPKAPHEFPFHSESTSKLVFNDSTLLLLYSLDPNTKNDDAYNIVRRIWKRHLIKSHFSDEITRSYETIIAKKDYPYRLSVTERVIT
jgi:hypothetical protein